MMGAKRGIENDTTSHATIASAGVNKESQQQATKMEIDGRGRQNMKSGQKSPTKRV
jgi:hypothetical protein